ncbi:MAG TPA: MoaD/ThiS family protein [Caulobacteraceae bacterium]|jgi:molybdopterin converting factor small subunit
MPRVVVADSSFRTLVGGLAQLDIEADNVRRLIEAIDRQYPGSADYIDKRMAIAVDGEIHQDAGAIPLTPASEVFLIPRIGGG